MDPIYQISIRLTSEQYRPAVQFALYLEYYLRKKHG